MNSLPRWLISITDIPEPCQSSISSAACRSTDSGRAAGPALKLKTRVMKRAPVKGQTGLASLAEPRSLRALLDSRPMTGNSFFWHDYETFGRVPRRDRPSQFAGVRTDAELNEIGEPGMQYCQPAPDYLPEPEACLPTRTLPQTRLPQSAPSHAVAALIEEQ